MADTKQPGVVLFVRFTSSLPREEAERRYKERMPQFRALPGLTQKYYLYDPETKEWGGLYIWDSQKSLDEYLVSDLRKTIAETYEVEGNPRVEIIPMIEPLRS